MIGRLSVLQRIDHLNSKVTPVVLIAGVVLSPGCAKFAKLSAIEQEQGQDDLRAFEEADAAFEAGSVSFSNLSSGSSSNSNSLDISGSTDEEALEGLSVKLHGTLDCSGVALATSAVSEGSYSFEDVTLTTEGSHSFYLQFGTGLCHATGLSYTYDTTAPASPSVTVNGGDSATQFPQLTLALSVTEANASGLQMCIAQNSSCSSCSYEAYSASPSMTLSDTSAGAKSISVKFRDAAGNESSCASDSISLSGLSVVPLYSSAAKWNSYVRSSDGTTACDGSETGYVDQVCIHGGERRKVVTAETSCAGLAMSDSQGAFDWSCSVVGGFAQFTSTLKQESRLADLIQGGATPAWRSLTVTLTKGTQSAQSSSEVWWTNSIEVPATNSGASDAVVALSAAETVY
jgi:hypothetical protein